MPALNLKAVDPAELMPIPEVPDCYGPRDEDEERIYALVKEGFDSGPGERYLCADDVAAELKAQLDRLTTR